MTHDLTFHVTATRICKKSFMKVKIKVEWLFEVGRIGNPVLFVSYSFSGSFFVVDRFQTQLSGKKLYGKMRMYFN